MNILSISGTWDTSKVTANQLFRLFYLVHYLAVLEPITQINGVVVIMDFNNLGLKQVKAFSPSFSMLLLSFIQNAMPLRLKEVHIVQQPFIFNMIWNIFKPFIEPKLKTRVSDSSFRYVNVRNLFASVENVSLTNKRKSNSSKKSYQSKLTGTSSEL